MSSKRVIGSVEFLSNLAVNGKYAMRSFNGVNPDANTGIITYPFYTREEVQKILDILPVSRIGEMDYLPPNVSGSFSGATSFSNDRRVQPCIIEDDGTAVIIRPGTNGSQFDFYYAYIRNVRNIPTLTQSDIVQTNTRYHPSYLTSTQKIEQFYGTDGYDLLWYRVSDSVNSSNYFAITLTNGSFNVVGHQHALIPQTSMPNFTPAYAHIVNGSVYMWGYDSTLGSGRALKLYTIPTSSLRSGVTTGLTAVTGFNGKTINGNAYTAASTARIYDTYASTTSTADCLIQYTSNMYSPEYHDYAISNAMAAGNADNTQIRFTMFPTYRYGSAYGFSGIFMYAISLVYNISTKTFTYDTTSLGKIVVNATLNGSTMTYTETANPYLVDATSWRGFGASLGNCGTICQAGDGFMVSTRSRWASSAPYGVSTSKINNFTSQFDSIKMTGRSVTANTQLFANPIYGSAIGENLMGPRLLSKTRMILACSGTYDGVSNASYDNTVVADFGTDSNFSYKSMTQGTLTGYAPQTYRKFANNDNFRLSELVTLMDSAGNVQASSTAFIENVKYTGGIGINPDTLEYTGSTVNMSNAVIQSLKQGIATSAGIPLNTSLLTVYYIPDTSYCNHQAVLMVRNPDNTGVVVLAEMNLTTSTSGSTITVTGGSVIRTFVQNRPNITSVNGGNYARNVGVCAGKFSGFNYLSVHSANNFGVPGDARSYSFFAKVKGGAIVSQRIDESYYSQTYGRTGGFLPGKGFGYYDNSVSDYQTKSVFQLFGTTEAQMDALIAGTGTSTPVVVMSQEVPEGFSVYFTQELPVFLGGMYDKLPIQTVDLRTIKADPSNTTFYIYVSMDRSKGEASYVISTALLDETLTRAFIGTIVTIDAGIDRIDAEKVTRFLTYRPSTYKRGSAIPASTGVPSGTGSRWH